MKLKTPDAPATPSQTKYIFHLIGQDVRDQNLTMQQASDRIAEILLTSPVAKKTKAKTKAKTKDKAKAKTMDKTTDKTVTSGPKSFQQMINEAVAAANAAGDKWMADHTNPAWAVMDGNKVVGTMLDVCGFAWIEIRDGRTAFAKWAKTTQYVNGGCNFLHVPHKYNHRQELGLAEACEGAAIKVLNENGIKGLRFTSRID